MQKLYTAVLQAAAKKKTMQLVVVKWIPDKTCDGTYRPERKFPFCFGTWCAQALRYPSLVPALLEQKNISTLERLLVHVREFPPHTLFQILCMILNSSEDQEVEDALGDLARRKRERVAAASESFKKKARTRNEDRVFRAVAGTPIKRMSIRMYAHSSPVRLSVWSTGFKTALDNRFLIDDDEKLGVAYRSLL